MEILSKRHPGLFFICEQCSALVGNVKESDIYENEYVYCPLCKYKQKINYNKSYDGFIEVIGGKKDATVSSNG